MAQPTDLQTSISAIQWTNGRGLITGATLLGVMTIVLGIFGTLGTWSASGIFTPNIPAGTVTAAQMAQGAAVGNGAMSPTGAADSATVGGAQLSTKISPTVLVPTGLVANSPAAGATNAAAINSTIQSMAAIGGGHVQLPCGSYYVSAPLDDDVPGVIVEGGGVETFHDGGAVPNTCTTILPTAAFTSGGQTVGVLRTRTPYGSGNAKNSGSGFLNLTVNGNGVGTRLLDVDSVGRCVEKGLTLIDAVGTEAAYFHNGVTGTSLAEAADTQNCDIELFVRQLDSTAAQAANLVTLDGSSNANFSYNRIKIRGQFYNGIALNAVNADNNEIDLAVQRAGSGTGNTAYMWGANHPYSGSVGGSSNVFTHLEGGGPIYAEGTDTSGVTRGMTNTVYFLDDGNGTPQPTAGTGTYWPRYQGLYGTDSDRTFANRSVLADTLTGAIAARVLSQGALASMVISNGSGAHSVWTDPAGANIWALGIDGSNFRIANLASQSSLPSIELPPIAGTLQISPGTYASSSGTINKLLFFNNFGIGLSPGSIDYISAGVHSFYISGTKTVAIGANGLLYASGKGDQFTPVPVASLPTCNAAISDTFMAVNDATAPTYRGALTGGGAVHTPVYCDGTNWTAH